jgi:hypothetical protein
MQWPKEKALTMGLPGMFEPCHNKGKSYYNGIGMM